MKTTTGSSGGRPMIMSARGVVSSGHYLATEIGLDVLRDGGNAFDAAAATGFALTALMPHQNGIGGEAPMVVYSAARQEGLGGERARHRAARGDDRALPGIGDSRHPRRRLPARAGPARVRQLDSAAAEIRKPAPVAAAGPGGRAGAHRLPHVRRPAREHRRIGEPLPRRMAVLGGGLPGQWRAAETGRDLAAAGLGGDVRPAPGAG